MKLYIGRSARIQGDARQWALERLSGSPAQRYYRHLGSALQELTNAPRRPHIYMGDELADLSWVAAAERRHLETIGTHPAAAGTYRGLPKGWRLSLPGVAELTRDARNLTVKPRGGELAFYERLDHALRHAWAVQVRKHPASSAGVCIEAMDAIAAPIMAWLDSATLPGDAS